MGTNGSGKSTILKLIARLYDPSEGKILIDGIDVKTLRLADLRRAISVLFQDYTLFPLSVRLQLFVSLSTVLDSKCNLCRSERTSAWETHSIPPTFPKYNKPLSWAARIHLLTGCLKNMIRILCDLCRIIILNCRRGLRIHLVTWWITVVFEKRVILRVLRAVEALVTEG